MSLLLLWYRRLFSCSFSLISLFSAFSVSHRGIKNTCRCSFMGSSPASVNQRLSWCLYSRLQAWVWFSWLVKYFGGISSPPYLDRKLGLYVSHLSVLTHKKTHEVLSTGIHILSSPLFLSSFFSLAALPSVVLVLAGVWHQPILEWKHEFDSCHKHALRNNLTMKPFNDPGTVWTPEMENTFSSPFFF